MARFVDENHATTSDDPAPAQQKRPPTRTYLLVVMEASPESLGRDEVFEKTIRIDPWGH